MASRRQTQAVPQRHPRSRAGNPVFLSFLLVTGLPAGEGTAGKPRVKARKINP